MFIGFANFYQRFIRGINRIAALLISMLKITGLFKKLALKTFKADNNEVVDRDGSRVNKTVRNSSRKFTRMLNIGVIGEPNFLISDAKKTFNHLRLVFIKAPIFQYFDLKSHIQIETDASSYAIGKVLSQLNLDSDALLNDLNKSDFGQ